MESHISATEVSRNLSDVLSRVHYRGEVFLVERGGQPICRIAPVGPTKCSARDLAQILRTGPKPDSDFWEELEKVLHAQPAAPEVRW